MAPDWTWFDKIYCISLEERPERRQEALTQFAKVGLAERVEFRIVKRHPTDRERGCYESHLGCMARGIAAGAERMLIFEDDVLFDRFSPVTLRNCIEFLDTDPDWHMLFFGCMVKRSRRTVNPAVINIIYRSLTHAYVIRRAFAETLVRKTWHGVPYDDFLRDLRDERMYAAYPAFAFQSAAPSDNTRYLPLDKVRRLIGGLHRLQKQNEIYHRYRWWIIGAHAAAVLAALLLAV
jgi:GR25 family glycosyltransferase involved in LPS biosynthesis